MARTSTRTGTAKAQLGVGTRDRDAEFPAEPLRVTGNARAKVIDISTVPQFQFGQQPRNNLPERPSTAGGPAGTNLPARRKAEKRETRDDLHFTTLNSPGDGTTIYNFPLPGAILAPRSTQKPSPLPLRKESLAPSKTPEKLQAGPTKMNVPQMQIGMALGSPSNASATWPAHVSFEPVERSASPERLDTSMDGWVSAESRAKHKPSRWKILGGLFGAGKKQSATQPFYQLQPEGTTHQTTVEADYIHFGGPPNSGEKSSEKRPKSRGRTYSEKKTEKHKPDCKRANTTPHIFDIQGPKIGPTPSKNPEIRLDGGPIGDTSAQQGRSNAHSGGPLLDIDIPSVQMERYSVMFGSVLGKPTMTSSSLLARRQATLERLKTVNEAIAAKERELEAQAKAQRPRRATSPQPTRSPTFSLFPSTPSRLTVKDTSPNATRRSPLQRSNTSPAALSPARPTFAPGSENEVHTALIETSPGRGSSAENREQGMAGSVKKLEPQPSTSSTPEASAKAFQTYPKWSPEESHLMLSPCSDMEKEEEEDIYDPTPFRMKPRIDEPSWQIINPHTHTHSTTSSVSGSAKSGSDHSTSNSASSISTTSTPQSASSIHKQVQIHSPPQSTRSRSGTTTSTTSTAPRPRRNNTAEEVSNKTFGSPSSSTSKKEEDDSEDRLKTAAEVSIARQISVSRQQRQILFPIKTSSNPSPNNKLNQNFPSPLNINRTASPLSVVATESPMIPGQDVDGGRKGSINPRLIVENVNPGTPTLVVVGDYGGERGKAWSGISTGSAEISVGLQLAPSETAQHRHRKSERVVVERISVASAI